MKQETKQRVKDWYGIAKIVMISILLTAWIKSIKDSSSSTKGVTPVKTETIEKKSEPTVVSKAVVAANKAHTR